MLAQRNEPSAFLSITCVSSHAMLFERLANKALSICAHCSSFSFSRCSLTWIAFAAMCVWWMLALRQDPTAFSSQRTSFWKACNQRVSHVCTWFQAVICLPVRRQDDMRAIDGCQIERRESNCSHKYSSTSRTPSSRICLRWFFKIVIRMRVYTRGLLYSP